MNKSYALVWNQALGCWNVASEWARRRGKTGRSKAVVAAAGVSLLGLLGSTPALALPTGGAVVAGNANLQTSADGKHMEINQQSNKLITQWNDFNVGADERVSFHQPGSDSVALNRVIGTNGSNIQGHIDANGKVFLVNPNGVVFGKSAQINVGGLVASSQNITDKDFLNGNYHFTGNSTAAVSNAGTLIAADGGSVALLGAQVSNTGVIQAQMGSVALAAGKDLSVNFDGNGLLNLQVNTGAVDALVHNGGLLKADGGQVLMTAKSADSLLKTVVSNQGVIEAKTLQNKAGRIILDGGDSGMVQVAGIQDASALNGQGNGGVVENRGAKIEVQSGAQVNTQADQGATGTWKIRSNEVLVADGNTNGSKRVSTRGVTVGGGINGNNGGNVSGGTSTPTVGADTLAKNLAHTNIELVSTNGNLSVDAPISWSSSNALALTAERGDVQINGALNASGSNASLQLNAKQGSLHLNDNVALTGTGASLTLNNGANGYSLKDGKSVTLSGTGASFDANGQSYEVVQNLEQLRNIENNMAGRYVLGNAINGSGRFKTIGDGDTFVGALDGLGNTIRDLSIYGTSSYVGLFGANQGQISNLNLERVSASGASSTHYNTQVGTLAGLNLGTIRNVKANDVHVTGASHFNTLGGLVGVNLGGTIANSSVSGKVTGNRDTFAMGGLVGENITHSNGMAQITNSRANTTLSGEMAASVSYYGNSAGGLVGLNDGGHIANASSQGSVTLTGDNLNIGGLVGHNIGNVSNATSSTNVTGGKNSLVGGLIGFNRQGEVANASASGQVTGNATQAIGGLIGKNLGNALANVSASGNVIDSSSRNVGGLVGYNDGGAIANAETTNTVTGGNSANVGGLVGYSQNATITNATTYGKAVGGKTANVGGMVGYNQNGTITNSTASGSVIGDKDALVGGLVGQQTGGKITNASAKGSVYGGQSSRVGGLVGVNSGKISTSSSSATVSGDYYATLGGLVGMNAGSISLSTASGKVDVSPSSGQLYGGLIGINFGQQSLNSVSGEALKVPLIGRNLRF